MTLPPANPTCEVARHIIARERKQAHQCLWALQERLDTLKTYQTDGGIRSHNVRDLITIAQDMHRYLLRVEALEELKP